MTNNPLYALMQHTQIGKKAAELAEKLNREMAELVELERPQKYRETFYHERRTAIATEIFDLAEAEKNRLEAAIEADRKAWTENAEKSLHARAARLQLAQTRYAAMNPQELRKEINRIAGAEYLPGDPIEIDALFEAARFAGVDEAELIANRETVVSKRYAEPWLQSPEARQREREIKLYAQQGKSPWTVPVISGNGEVGRLDIDDLLDGTDPKGSEE